MMRFSRRAVSRSVSSTPESYTFPEGLMNDLTRSRDALALGLVLGAVFSVLNVISAYIGAARGRHTPCTRGVLWPDVRGLGSRRLPRQPAQ